MYSSQGSVESRGATIQSTTGHQHVFKRRQTIATLSTPPADTPPAQAAASLGGSVPDDPRRSRGSLRHQQHVRSPTISVDADAAPGAGTQRQQGKRLHNRLSSDGSQPQSSSCLAAAGYGASGCCTAQQHQQPHRKLGRTPSSPSVLFSRVKERIREKVWRHVLQ